MFSLFASGRVVSVSSDIQLLVTDNALMLVRLGDKKKSMRLDSSLFWDFRMVCFWSQLSLGELQCFWIDVADSFVVCVRQTEVCTMSDLVFWIWSTFDS